MYTGFSMNIIKDQFQRVSGFVILAMYGIVVIRTIFGLERQKKTMRIRSLRDDNIREMNIGPALLPKKYLGAINTIAGLILKNCLGEITIGVGLIPKNMEAVKI